MEPIDTANRFAVGLAGNGIAILGSARLLRGPISTDDALNLAAYLATLADPAGDKFQAVLEAVRNT